MIEKRLLFVCLGNICRSPAAEAVMNSKLKNAGLDHRISCDSAGIIGYHSGERADVRIRNLGKKRGYSVNSISRKVKPLVDFNHFDMIIGMDEQNLRDLHALAQTDHDRSILYRMTDFCSIYDYNHVPDPYYGEHKDFELVFDLLEDACNGLVGHLLAQKR